MYLLSWCFLIESFWPGFYICHPEGVPNETLRYWSWSSTKIPVPHHNYQKNCIHLNNILFKIDFYHLTLVFSTLTMVSSQQAKLAWDHLVQSGAGVVHCQDWFQFSLHSPSLLLIKQKKNSYSYCGWKISILP